MRVVALLAVRNEELYLERCLQHLVSQGVETCVIDNDSSDRTRMIAEGFLGRGVFRIDTFPYRGYYDWVGILAFKQRLAEEVSADWFIHHDADEIREASSRFATLRDGLAAADRSGANAVNFDEFVFVPTDVSENYEGRDYVAEMKAYYHFEPKPLHRVNAWKKQSKVDLVSSGGHNVAFDGRVIYEEPFVLRHYIVLSAAHAIRKYGRERTYSRQEVEERHWHGWRAHFQPTMLRLPDKKEMKYLDGGSGLDKSTRRSAHIFICE